MKLAHYSFIDLSILRHNHKRQVVRLYHHIITSVGFFNIVIVLISPQVEGLLN